jgi:hypothetical protein
MGTTGGNLKAFRPTGSRGGLLTRLLGEGVLLLLREYGWLGTDGGVRTADTLVAASGE